jgi:hypothetical protein
MHDDEMATWTEMKLVAPEIGALAQARLEATGIAMLATLRRDGWPRISGIETMFRADGELYLGMMLNSTKALDLRRDSRMCLHNATVDKDVKEGDIKIIGRAIEIVDKGERGAFRDEVKAATEYDVGDDFHLFRVEVQEVSTVRPGGDVLLIDSWREGEAPKHIERK